MLKEITLASRYNNKLMIVSDNFTIDLKVAFDGTVYIYEEVSKVSYHLFNTGELYYPSLSLFLEKVLVAIKESNHILESFKKQNTDEKLLDLITFVKDIPYVINIEYECFIKNNDKYKFYFFKDKSHYISYKYKDQIVINQKMVEKEMKQLLSFICGFIRKKGKHDIWIPASDLTYIDISDFESLMSSLYNDFYTIFNESEDNEMYKEIYKQIENEYLKII